MSAAPILINAAWAPNESHRIARTALLAVAGSLLIAVCAHIRVPMWPVPMTMQTFAVLLIGFAYGSRLGAATVALYLAEGAVGLPVFTGGGGVAHLAVIFLFGGAWLTVLLGFEKAFMVGVVPFLVGDAVKAALAAVLLPMAWNGLSKLS
ncbi:MAG: hypothetical protein K0Q80_2195 [Microvirga sp.]|nr:hypothetical protein [Microvirga sp.]